MKKFLAPIIVAAVLCGNLALCEAQRTEIIAESVEINEEYVYFYEMTISNPELSPQRKNAYQTSYRTFITSMNRENYRNNPELYSNLED